MSQQTDDLNMWLVLTTKETHSSEDVLEIKRIRTEMHKALALSRIADALEISNEIQKFKSN